MDKSTRLGLPFLAAGQGQKEVTVNEGLLLLDALVQAVCEGSPANVPPANPVFGGTYLCGPAPQGDWPGHANALAFYTDGGWRFVASFQGLTVLDRLTRREWFFDSVQWRAGRIVAAPSAAISGPSGGTVVDLESRSNINQILTALRVHGIIDS